MRKLLLPLLLLLALAAPLLASQVFFENVTADGQTEEFFWPLRSPFASGSVDIGAPGAETFDGATIVLQQSFDGLTWANMKNENGADALSCTSTCKGTLTTAGVWLRFDVSGAGAGTDVDIRLRGPR